MRLALEHGQRQITLACKKNMLERFARLKAQPKRNVVRVARLRRPPLLSTLRFPQSSSPTFQGIVGKLLAALETAPLDAHDFHHLEVKLCSLARRLLGRNACVFEGGRIVKKLGAAVTRRLALCPPDEIQLRQRRLKWLQRQLIWEQSTGHPSPPLAALFGTFSWSEPPVKTDGTLSPTAPRLLVIIADDLQAFGLPLTSPTWNVDLIQGRLSSRVKSHQTRILSPRKMSQHCLLSYSTHAMSVSGLDDPKDPCEVTRS